MDPLKNNPFTAQNFIVINGKPGYFLILSKLQQGFATLEQSEQKRPKRKQEWWLRQKEYEPVSENAGAAKYMAYQTIIVEFLRGGFKRPGWLQTQGCKATS